MSETLRQATTKLGRAALEARSWVQDVAATAPSVANEAHSLVTAARRAANLGRKLGGAAGRRPCVGVFGPSQAGKSYLVSALARRPGGSLTCDFAGVHKDFLREVNPPGDRESTGLVTRFTTSSSSGDTDFPVELRLLSETDLVKVLANAYLSDFDPNNLKITPPSEEAVRAVVAAAESAAAATAAAAHLDEIVLFDIGEYFERYFSARIETLRRTGYWDALIRLAGRLPLARRARLYAPLWGGIAELTDLFLLLAGGLERLGHAADARAALDALVPRDASIIDVATLERLSRPEDDADLIRVRPVPTGGAPVAAPIELPRALLASLVAEIRIPIADTPWPFMAGTDLLDFPGARARQKMIEIEADEAKRTRQIREMLLRGKIAYLFQRFTEERELTAMLLCMPGNPAEVKDLAAMVQGWIGLTHGDTPTARAGVRNALFLVLTKFDLEFIEKGGETSETRRGKWDRRLHASFLELYGHSGWPDDWDGKPFANALFLRNPGMKQEHIMSYASVERLPDGSEQLVEKAPLDAKAGLIAEYKSAFLGSELCSRHFGDREAVWSAAFAPNDGGVSYLVQRLTNTLDESLKAHQIGERLSEQARTLNALLRRFHHADDDLARQNKDKAFAALRLELYRLVAPQQYRPFARLMTAMALEDREVRECFMNVAALKLDAHPTAEDAALPVADPWSDDPWAEPPAGGDRPAAAPSTPSGPVQDRPALFARELMNLWADKLRRVAQNAARLGLTSRLVEDLCGELIVGANRLGLADRIAATVRQQIQAANVRWEDSADRAVSLAVPVLNDFCADLGTTAAAAANRPRRPRSEEPVFAPPPAFTDLPVLQDKRLDLEAIYFLDWATALHRLALDNVGFSGGREIDDTQNARLGRILSELAPLTARAG